MVAVNSNEVTMLKFVKLKVCGDCKSIPGIKNKTTKTNTDGSILKKNTAVIKDKIKLSFCCFLTLSWLVDKFLFLLRALLVIIYIKPEIIQVATKGRLIIIKYKINAILPANTTKILEVIV